MKFPLFIFVYKGEDGKMGWSVIIVSIISSVVIGIFLYRMDKKNNKKPTGKKSEKE